MLLPRRSFLIALILLVGAALLWFWRAQLLLLLRLLLGGCAAAYLLYPLAQIFERRARLPRPASIWAALLSLGGALILLAVLFLPPLIAQMREMLISLPQYTDMLRGKAHMLNDWLTSKGFRRLSLPEFDWQKLFSSLPPLLGGTASFAGSVVSFFTEWTLVFMLGYYFLRDRERLALHLELMAPLSIRRTVLRMADAVHHEISAFLRGQLLISAAVAALSAAGLMLSGVRAFLPLGLLVGVFNMIPYFGPVLGAIPVVLMALSQGFGTALLAAGALFAVQQIDSLFISPRIMGALTGLHPASVLLSITLGSSLFGLTGMLLAIPCQLAVRAVSRVWVARTEGN